MQCYFLCDILPVKKGGELLNHVILIGRLVDTPSLETNSTGLQRMTITLAVPRTYRNQEGIYETDFIRCVLWNGIAHRTKEYCQKGDMVSVRGRLQIRSYENEEHELKYVAEVVVESITFITNKKYAQEKNESEDK